jgi:hypothetical protein
MGRAEMGPANEPLKKIELFRVAPIDLELLLITENLLSVI